MWIIPTSCCCGCSDYVKAEPVEWNQCHGLEVAIVEPWLLVSHVSFAAACVESPKGTSVVFMARSLCSVISNNVTFFAFVLYRYESHVLVQFNNSNQFTNITSMIRAEKCFGCKNVTIAFHGYFPCRGNKSSPGAAIFRQHCIL